MILNDNLLWVEKYRPREIAATILPQELKNTFKQFVVGQYVPNLMLCGPPGVGKTTVARAMLDECGFEYIVINGSLDRGIDVLRTQIQQYASSVSLQGTRKYVILDEADHLSNLMQPALRSFMEEFSKNCGFIFTCNYKNRIIDALHSRCSVIDFKIPKKEKANLAAQFLKKIKHILDNENIKYTDKVLVELITKYFPDWRRCINEAQRYASVGEITSDILVNTTEESFVELMTLLKERNFKKMRSWVGQNSNIESNELFRKIYDTCYDYIDKTAIPKLVLILADYQYKNAFVADHEINLAACLTEIMAECEFK